MLPFLPALERLQHAVSSSSGDEKTLWLALSLVICAAGVTAITRGSTIGKGQQEYWPDSTLPVLGNTLDLLRNHETLYDWLTEHSERANGRTWRVQFFGRPPTYLLCTPECNEDVQKTYFANFDKGERLRFVLGDMLGGGIFAADGEAWAKQRKAASHLFTHRALRESMTSTVHKHTEGLLKQLSVAVETQEPLDLFRLMNRFSMETFAELAFGCEMRSDSVNDEHPFQKAFDAVQVASLKRVLYPDWMVRIRRFFGVGYEGELARGLKVVNDTIMGIIGQSIKERDNSQSEISSAEAGGKNNLVRLYLDNVVSESSTDSSGLNLVGLRDFVVNFFMAGRDSTAQTLSWFFYCISQNPSVEKALVKELKVNCPALFDSCATLDERALENVHHLVYLEAAIKETLRLYPPVPVNSRNAIRETELSDGTVIPAGANVSFLTYSMGRLTSVWGEDAKEYKPERWLDSETGRLITVSSFKFNSFFGGPRSCLGMNLALLESKIVAAAIMSRFRVDVNPGQTVTYRRSITLMMRDPFMVKIQKREA